MRSSRRARTFVGPSLAALLTASALLTVNACASPDQATGDTATQAQTGTTFADGTPLSADQLMTLASIGDGSKAAAILFPSNPSVRPEVRGHLVPGGRVTVVYALDRAPRCRATHDGFGFWRTRLGGEFSNGTLLGEELAPTANGFGSSVPGDLVDFASGPGGTFGSVGHVVPVSFDIPAAASSFDLYFHNANPGGPVEACDSYDSNNGANYVFNVDPAVPGPGSGLVEDGSHATASDLESLVDIGDGTKTAAILFPADPASDPVVKGTLVAGGRLIVAYALERLSSCRALHDGFPFWITRLGGQFSDGTKIGDAAVPSTAWDSHLPGTLVRFVPVPGREEQRATSLATVVTVPKGVTSLDLYAHNSNPGGPVEACSAYDSKGGANYHFAVTSAPHD